MKNHIENYVVFKYNRPVLFDEPIIESKPIQCYEIESLFFFLTI